MSGPSHACLWKIFIVRLCCARTVPIVNVPQVVTAWNAVGIPRADVPCLVQVVSAMATGGARDACVSEQDIPSKCETLVLIV